jgi:hypothetical protein
MYCRPGAVARRVTLIACIPRAFGCNSSRTCCRCSCAGVPGRKARHVLRNVGCAGACDVEAPHARCARRDVCNTATGIDSSPQLPVTIHLDGDALTFLRRRLLQLLQSIRNTSAQPGRAFVEKSLPSRIKQLLPPRLGSFWRRQQPWDRTSPSGSPLPTPLLCPRRSVARIVSSLYLRSNRQSTALANRQPYRAGSAILYRFGGIERIHSMRFSEPCIVARRN